MTLGALLPVLLENPELDQLLAEPDSQVAVPLGAAPILTAIRARKSGVLQVVVTASGRDADNFASFVRAYLDSDSVAVFPSWETLPHERLSPRSDTIGQRMKVLRQLAHPEEFAPLSVLVVPVRALLQPVVAGLGEIEPIRARVGDFLDFVELQERLVELAYRHVDMVESRGEFAVRGGIIDIFPPTEKHPIRVEFFGDEVETIRSFAVNDQRSLADESELFAPSCREILLTDAVRARASEALTSLPGAADMLEQIAQGIFVEGMESLAPVLVEQLEPLVELLPKGAQLMLAEPERIAAHEESLLATSAEFLAAAWSAASGGGKIPLGVDEASFAELDETLGAAHARGITVGEFSSFNGGDALTLDLNEPQNFAGQFGKATEVMRMWASAGWRVLIVAEGSGLARRLADSLGEEGVAARVLAPSDGGGTGRDEALAAGVVTVTSGALGGGFVWEGGKLAVLVAEELVSRARRGVRGEKRAMPKRRKAGVDPLQLKPGDFVVHERHGVGQFVKLAKRTLGGPTGGGTQREYVVVEYAASKRGGARDQLWIPTDQLDQLSKYVGGDSPSLNKMGGADWAKAKSKAKAAVRQIAKELIRLYAQRRATKGFAFSPDTPWQRELEDAFEFVETPDQLVTIDEVKRDMESPEPMDRLISGDVGYGKTEIALRAAFKAVQDQKQVAVLVPTTLLVQQHLDTFRDRFAGFPVRVEGLSRFQTVKESDAVKAGLKDGTVDVVIGTHRLLTGDVRFKDLGLVVIDEEQRFGVEHKETLKQLYPAVDVLSMSATPIPRTLEMAVTGIRQMSQLATPPEERHPILTYVGAWEAKQVSAAIKREMLRGGQVFYIHNRTESIDKVAMQLGELVPEVRIGVAHGKMSEAQLESVIQQFWEKEIDVLVCTTIVETGLDISNANTLIVEDAQRLGLSQLHQLRGRVGRGRERAYAYFLYPGDKSMTETAIERLRTIAAHTELGAGIQVALKDLEIRGAGNLLGGEQSGHIAGVGFDLYIRMVGDAVAELTGQKAKSEAEETADVRIELPIDAYVPESWVASERLRLEIYTKIAVTLGDDARADVRAELTDRYGEIPPEVERLFRLAKLRELARSVGLEEITVAGPNVRFAPVVLPDSRQLRLRRLYPRAVAKSAVRTVLVPLPKAGESAMRARLGGTTKLTDEKPATNEAILDFVELFISTVLGE